MKRLFLVGIACLVIFEIANVWLVMPLPGSQRLRSIDVAYALYGARWAVRAVCAALILAGLRAAWRAPGRRRWIVPASLAVAAAVVWAANVRMAADHMFRRPKRLVMAPAARSTVDPNRLVVGIEIDGDARAYPLQYLGYHHQVRDSVGGRPVLVSYCTVCRSGRVFDPIVDGRAETFRLVGMDHWNAMFEDHTTRSWWRQASGAAIVGARTGATLRELPSRQTTLKLWLAMHPHSLVMQPDSASLKRYAKNFDYESGASRSTLTGTDTVSWREKAWVVGLSLGGEHRAYDWNRLRRERVVNDVVGGTPVVVAMADDRASFVAFTRPDPETRFALRGDSLVGGGRSYALTGRGATDALTPVTAYQEFWHSWRTFHPGTTTY
ncbi:DUF3179 domain-containing (seleno)protein [Roseisolibacter agri]|uniref:DUF3179 domain-containing protein n=1 Tax=Roseisolibacter agri TaxID=2014610 RepID=A0AA37Q8U6_9BACT|nr:DUF3179 domain-containing (seleno)protein [Roseisolibacter agri]GLC25186.1 hypothetical protein rosag_16990 [Roseisolibacter agri]